MKKAPFCKGAEVIGQVGVHLQNWLTAKLEGVTYTKLNLGTGSCFVAVLGEVEEAVIITDDNLESSGLDTSATANIDVEGILIAAVVLANFFILCVVSLSAVVVSGILSGR